VLLDTLSLTFAYHYRFRWVSCQLDHLCELPTDALRRKALTCLPTTLNETYARVLTRVEASARPLVRRTLQWITYAHHSGLSVEQLSEIVAIDEKDEELDPEACPDIEDLLRYCGSLVRRTSGFSYTSNSSCTKLELAHFTVQEFLEAINPNDAELNEFRLSSTDELILAKTCLNYLCLPSFNQPPFDFEEDFEDHPFYHHATICLTNYVGQVTHDDDIQRYLQRLFRPPKSYNLTRLVLHYVPYLRDEAKEDEWVDELCSYEFSSLHAAAMFGFGTVCRWLLDEGCDINQKSALGTPLEWVVVGPYFMKSGKISFHLFEHLFQSATESIISTLIEAGAAYDVDGGDLNSLLLAVFHGPWTLSVEMLRYGMPLSESFTHYLEENLRGGNKLFLENFVASINGVEDEKIPLDVRMRLLDLARANGIPLETNSPLDTRISTMQYMSDETYADAVVYTAKYGPVSNLLHLTTDERFSVNMEGPCRSATLLHIAAEHNSPECMELLLDKGFDAAQLDESGCTVLQHAISYGIKEEPLLRRLIQSNATEVVDRDGRGVWHVVAEKGRLDVLDLLIAELGPDHPYLCIQSKLGRTPFLDAILYRENHIAFRMLRSLPANKVLATDPQAIHSAIATGLEDILQELVQMGASLHSGSDQDRSALYFVTQETTPGILRMLLNHGLDVNHLDIDGRSPLLDFLEVDQHSQRLKALGYSESDSTYLSLSVMELLATTFCTTTQDKKGNFAWFYFCTKTIPHHLLRPAPLFELDSLVAFSDILTERGGLKAYEEATINSGIALLIEMCLDTVSKPSIEDQEFITTSVKAVIRHVLETTTANSLPVSHPQAVRLLLWSITQSDNDVIEQLLRLGVDVHATCGYYDGDSAIDIAIKGTIEARSFDKILAHADPVRVPKLDAEGSMRHFELCRPETFTDEEHAARSAVGEAQREMALRVSKLKTLLQRGVDPNARSIHGWTAAIEAAVNGQLECMKLLVAFSADLLLTDQTGWTVIHYAIDGEHLILLEYLRQIIRQDEEWTRPATLVMLSSLSDGKPLGPLSHWNYHRCSPTHFAAYNYTSDTLQFLHGNNVVGNINAEAQDGVTPLHFAVCMNSPHTTRWLLKHGADIKAKCGKRKISALHVAMRWGCLETAIALVEAGAEFCADSTGITPEMQVDPAICADLLELLLNVGFPISPIVMEAIRRRLKLKSSGSLYRAIVNGDLEACNSIIATTPCLPKVVEECAPCTPLVVALSHNQLDIAKLFLDHGASTYGVPCRNSANVGFQASALEIAIRKPILNPLLKQLLEQCLLHETHWSQRFGYWRPFHVAAAFNPGAIEILANHVVAHVNLFRYVRSSRLVVKDTLRIYQAFMG
jgi:ankyrin repeat protein